MGEHTRVGTILPKTECKKALTKTTEHRTQPIKEINEDIILQILDSKKCPKKDLQDACLALGVSSEGSIADLTNRLQELLNFKDVYSKLFVKLQKAGDGVLHFSCMHGVVYHVNFLFWMESARDHCDGLLSFKRFPTCYISDVAGQVARHTNNRTNQLFFKLHDGRLCSPTQDNTNKAKTKELQAEMDRVKQLRCPLPQQPEANAERMSAKHPVTGTSERFSLYDRFHQKNQKRQEEKLRSLNICSTLRKEINSAVAEQFDRELASARYSLCQMTETHFKQTLRVLIELHNNINTQLKSEMETLCNAPLSLGLSGMLGLQPAGNLINRHGNAPIQYGELCLHQK
ncbi:uncharacterized protein [Nothobranchius furzeri]|uniref:uncharacterized protein n=1 Tax=Nothobranchius furzeri TaxID=105023 RepID=UPI003904A5DD